MATNYLGIPHHSASWKFLWIFYTMLAVVVSAILAFQRPFDAIVRTTTVALTTGSSTTVYGVTWWRFAVNLAILLVVLVVIPYSIRYFARQMHRKNNLGSGTAGSNTA